MSKARITVAVRASESGEPFEVLIYLNPEGRDRLVKELSALDESAEHFHLMGPAWGPNDLQGTAYKADETVMPHLKVLFRSDTWDEQYFPHVMKTASPSP